MDIPHTTKLYHMQLLIAFVQISGRLHYELRMHTHTHVHVTTSLAHYTHTHLGAVSHSVDDTLQQKDQGTSPSEKGTEKRGWEPIEVAGELRQEEREKGISEQTASHKHTHTPKCMHACTHTENKISLMYNIDKTLLYTHTICGLCIISVTVIHDICTQRSALCRPSQ